MWPHPSIGTLHKFVSIFKILCFVMGFLWGRFLHLFTFFENNSLHMSKTSFLQERSLSLELFYFIVISCHLTNKILVEIMKTPPLPVNECKN